MKHDFRPIGCVAAIVVGLMASSAHAYDWVVSAKVVSLEATYMPASINFAIDRAAGSCGTGAFFWRPDEHASDPDQQNQNAMAILA